MPRTLLSAHKSKSYEERELEYNEARSRIFNTDSVSHSISCYLSCVVYFYSAPIGERSFVIGLSVCASVCLRAYLWNCWTDLQKIFVQIPFGRGSVLLWRHCATLCTYSFKDDVTFGCNGPYGDVWKGELLTYYR